MIKPQFKHDCNQCKFLGTYEIPGDTTVQWDLYWCPQNGHWPTVVARYADERSCYISGMPTRQKFYDEHPHYPLHEAYRQAKVQGYEVSPLR